jgi:hypothetical protein
MRTIFLIVFLALGFARDVDASSVIAVEITTPDRGTIYALNKGNSSKAEPATLKEIETWARTAGKEFGGPILIYTDDRTSFRTVLDLLRLLKAAGITRFEVVFTEEREGERVLHTLSGKGDDLKSHSSGATKSAK